MLYILKTFVNKKVNIRGFQKYSITGLLHFARKDKWRLCRHCEHLTPALHFGVVHERNAFLRRTREKIASGNVIALAMTAEERHCESAVADAAVSSYITHEKKFLRRSGATMQSQ